MGISNTEKAFAGKFHDVILALVGVSGYIPYLCTVKP